MDVFSDSLFEEKVYKIFQDVLFNVDISAMYADADAVVRIAKVKFEYQFRSVCINIILFGK